MTLTSLLAFAFASFLIIIVPGPTVTVIVANSIRDGARAGLLNVAGTQLGLLMMMVIVAFGLDAVVAIMADAFFWLKLLGAAYLVWLGIKLLRSTGEIETDEKVQRPKSGYFWQGFFVIWSNPKALLFFGAFIPQFISTDGDPFWQILLLGGIFMAVGAVFDGLYAVLAGKAGSLLTRSRVKLVERISGCCLVAGGGWLATVQRV